MPVVNTRIVTTEQRELLLQTIELTPEMAHNPILETGSNKYDKEWSELTEKLNALHVVENQRGYHWKTVLINWKLSVKAKVNDDNTENKDSLDDMGKRLLSLIQEEETVVRDPMLEVFERMNELDDGQDVFRRPFTRSLMIADMAEQIEGEELLKRKDKCLEVLFQNNSRTDIDPDTRNRIMQTQLNRLHRVSLDLESHIQAVQNRIQMIRDRWQHECEDE